ncbi:MAG: type II toxin-antitoxin system RelE/ParE family toxin [Herbaspirillum sp.]
MILVWLPSANVTRDEQLDYIAQDNFLAAIDQDKEIEKQVDMLLDHPDMGRPGRVKTTRELVIGRTSFIVAYRAKDKRIEILRVLHGSQQWPHSMREMLRVSV